MATFPGTPRPGQDEMFRFLRRSQSKGQHAVVEAPTGLGKTLAALAASIDTSDDDGRRILITTRTNSQQVQVLREAARLRRKKKDPGLLVPFIGRKQACPLYRDDARFRDASPDEFSRLCRGAKAKARTASGDELPDGACPYFAKILQEGTDGVCSELTHYEGDDVVGHVEAMGHCPYESLKRLLPKARLVVFPYIFLIDDGLRRAFVEWLGEGPDAFHLIVDEAHNLPTAARSHHSLRLTTNSLKRALREVEQFGNPLIGTDTRLDQFLAALVGAIIDLQREFLHGENEGLLPPDALQHELMARLQTSSIHILRMAEGMQFWGEQIREQRRLDGKRPMSSVGATADFLTAWFLTEPETYVHVVTGGQQSAIEACRLDAAGVLSWLHEFTSTAHMSGTLSPLEEYRDVCGLGGDAPCKRIVDDSDQRLVINGVRGLHRRWQQYQDDPQLAARQQMATRKCMQAAVGKTGIFFPSHQMLRDWVEEGFLHNVARPVYIEAEEMDGKTLNRLVRDFSDDPDPGALLLAVMGGRTSEGMDYPGDAMRNQIILGIPYPRPSARLQALIHHLDQRHGAGWTYAVHNPTARVLRQTMGRLLRGPDERGAVTVLDERIARFWQFFPQLSMIDDVAAVPERQNDGFRPATTWVRRCQEAA